MDINAGFSTPTDHSIVKLAFAGVKRLAGKTCNKKEPFTVDIIKEIDMLRRKFKLNTHEVYSVMGVRIRRIILHWGIISLRS